MSKVQMSGGKPYRGISCDKTLNIGNELIIHVPPHKGEKTYLRFNFFWQYFMYKDDINVCIPPQTGEEYYRCYICDGALRDKVRRRIHMPSHTGEGPYQCNMSGKAFYIKDMGYMSNLGIE